MTLFEVSGAFVGVSDGASDGQVPEEIVLLPAGRVEADGYAPFIVDAVAAKEIIRRFDERGVQLVIDYEHQTLEGQEAPAAGWVSSLSFDPKRGLIGTVQWTPRAKERIAAREYRYLSPVVFVRKEDRRAIFLHSVALTNVPRIHNMEAIAATFLPRCGLPQQKSEQGGDVVKELKQFFEEMAQALSLSLTIDEERLPEAAEPILAALKERLKEKTDEDPKDTIPEEVLTALSLPAEATVSEVVASIHALKQKDAAIDLNAFKAMQEELLTMKATKSVELALSEGKITPAQRDWALDYAKRDPEGFQAFVAKAPVIVVEGKVAPTGGKAPGGLDETQLTINRMLGIDEETFKKYGER